LYCKSKPKKELAPASALRVKNETVVRDEIMGQDKIQA
jgi:hypothetical protein